MAKRDQLEAYRKKRDFGHTAEPKGTKRRRSAAHPIFVIQKHKASRLHYDFRIEVGGVLKSWAVPKGPSTNPKEKRLAVPTEDHPLAYARFEGTIPEGQYGGGTVMVWDIGRYTNLKKKNGRTVAMRQAVKGGQVEIELHGKKLRAATPSSASARMARTGAGCSSK
jgi:DNA ligase D-like protein (predicted 3'-phosphoesterase)